MIPSEFLPSAPLTDTYDDYSILIGLRIHERLEENSSIFSPSNALSLRKNLETNNAKDTTLTTTTADAIRHKNSDEISTPSLLSTLCKLDELTPTAYNRLEETPSPDLPSTTHINISRKGSSRVCPPRSSKTKALEEISAMTNSLPDDAREILQGQLPNL